MEMESRQSPTSKSTPLPWERATICWISVINFMCGVISVLLLFLGGGGCWIGVVNFMCGVVSVLLFFWGVGWGVCVCWICVYLSCCGLCYG
jgi:hypothetical protein